MNHILILPNGPPLPLNLSTPNAHISIPILSPSITTYLYFTLTHSSKSPVYHSFLLSYHVPHHILTPILISLYTVPYSQVPFPIPLLICFSKQRFQDVTDLPKNQVSFAFLDRNQIKERLGSSTLENYLSKMYHLTWHDIYYILIFTLTPDQN